MAVSAAPPLLLADLMRALAAIARAAAQAPDLRRSGGAARHRAASPPTAAQVRAGRSVRRAAGRARRRPRASSPTRWRAARRRCWRPPGTDWPAGVPPRPLIADPEPRRRLAQIAAVLAGPQPETRGRRHRHQRQDQHGRVPAPDLGARRRPCAPRGQPGHARADRARASTRAPA